MEAQRFNTQAEVYEKIVLKKEMRRGQVTAELICGDALQLKILLLHLAATVSDKKRSITSAPPYKLLYMCPKEQNYGCNSILNSFIFLLPRLAENIPSLQT